MNSPPTSHDQSARTDDARWFAQEVHAHDAALKHYLRTTFPAIRDVEDIAQESYLRLWRLRAVEPIRSARAFLFTIAQRVALDSVRRLRNSPFDPRAVSADVHEADGAPAGGEHLGRAERVQLLIEAIDALPPRCREVVMLRKLQLVSQRETAEKLHISEKGVEIQLARAVVRCRDYLRRRGMVDFDGYER